MVVLSGNDKGKSGKVTRVFPKTGMVVVEGVAIRTKHQRARKAGQRGQIVEKQHAISASKVAKKDKTKKK